MNGHSMKKIKKNKSLLKNIFKGVIYFLFLVSE